MVKAYVCKAAEWVTREAMQIHGGFGYAEEYDVSRYFVDARVLSIFEGADETLCLKVIARRLVDNVEVAAAAASGAFPLRHRRRALRASPTSSATGGRARRGDERCRHALVPGGSRGCWPRRTAGRPTRVLPDEPSGRVGSTHGRPPLTRSAPSGRTRSGCEHELRIERRGPRTER